MNHKVCIHTALLVAGFARANTVSAEEPLAGVGFYIL